MLSPVVIFIATILLGSPLGEAKTQEQWDAIEKQANNACLLELNLLKELGANFSYDSVESFTKPEEFSRNIRCFMKCVDEKMCGQDMSDMKKFIEKGSEYEKDMFKNLKWSPAKVKRFMELEAPCDAIRTPDNCDTLLMMFLCEKQAFKAVETMN